MPMSTTFSHMADAIDAIQERIAQAAARAGRLPSEIELIAVSKTHPLEAIREARDCGLRLFGENKVQETRAKVVDAPSDLRWHLIGHLQSNKIRHALPIFEMIHSVDSLDLAKQIDRIAEELGLFPKILLEVNVAGESSKFGFSPDALRASIEALCALPRLQIEGLMTIAPYAEEAELSRPFFQQLRGLRDELAIDRNIPLAHLSMGMSGDFEVAIEEGATLVRVGTAIFGARNYAKNKAV
jgi:PLP dependent protein